MLRITSSDLLDFKVVNGIIAEPEGGAHTAVEGMAKVIRETLVREIDDLCKRNPAVLVRYRNQKIRKVGHWNEN
jgi:acetyl-CoA carboxylase carboxyl transferase subunit alpha